MRIIAGVYRGRPLATARDLSIRPMTDRARQAVFDVLSHRFDFEGIAVLDLFAGSGSLGLEAISRGARHVTFVDKSRASLEILEKNINSLDCSAKCLVCQADAFWYLKNLSQAFDLVFADPPYALENIGVLPNAVYGSAAVRNGTYVVMEHSRRSVIDVDVRRYEVVKKSFGQTSVLILKAIVTETV